MAIKKFLKIGSTGITEEGAVATSAGAGDVDKIPQLDANGKLDITFMPTGVGGDTQTLTAGEALSAGNLVYVNASGNVLKADASSEAKEAVAFVTSAISNAATGTVYFGSGIITGLTGLTAGSRYFLSGTTPGAVTTTAPTGTGKIVQQVGRAISTTVLYFEPQAPVLLI
jgi:hypothetical protein